jgi:predicted metal-dependent hydrolase
LHCKNYTILALYISYSSNKKGIKIYGEILNVEIVRINGVEFTIMARLKDVRNARARLGDGIIFITLPIYLSEESRKQLYEKLKLKIIKRIEKIDPEKLKSPMKIVDGQSINAMGRAFTISIKRCNSKRYSTARIIGNNIEIKLACTVSNGQESRIASKLAIKALSKALLSSVEDRVAKLNSMYFNAQISRVRIRNNSTLWGSYSQKSNSISINFKLLLAPQDIMDYVIIHELAHTKVHNHNKRFWDIVANIMPDYIEKRRWLRINGNRIGIS